MKKSVWWGVLLLLAVPEFALAQPIRQLPGTRPYLPGSPPINQVPLNPRTRATPDGIGVESTDFYGKKGYPKQLGDARETQTTGGSATTGTLSGGSASTGSVSGGLAGTSGGLSGGLSGGGLSGGSTGIAGFRSPFGGQESTGITGGGFSGLVPKGFGFGGVPTFEFSSSYYKQR